MKYAKIRKSVLQRSNDNGLTWENVSGTSERRRTMKQKVFKIYFHKVTDIKPKIEVFETKAHNRKDALDVFREQYGTLSAVDFIEKGKC